MSVYFTVCYALKFLEFTKKLINDSLIEQQGDHRPAGARCANRDLRKHCLRPPDQ